MARSHHEHRHGASTAKNFCRLKVFVSQPAALAKASMAQAQIRSTYRGPNMPKAVIGCLNANESTAGRWASELTICSLELENVSRSHRWLIEPLGFGELRQPVGVLEATLRKEHGLQPAWQSPDSP